MDVVATPACLNSDCGHLRCLNCPIEKTIVKEDNGYKDEHVHYQKIYRRACCQCLFIPYEYSPNSHMTQQRPSNAQPTNPIPDNFGPRPVVICVAWNLLNFIKTQLNGRNSRDLGSVITLTGCVNFSQATSCAAYLEQNWPRNNAMVLETLQAAVNDPGLKADRTFSGLELAVDCSKDGSVVVHAKGTDAFIEDVVGQLCWMGAALRASTHEKLEYVRNTTTNRNHDLNICIIGFDTSQLAENETACWLPLFCNAAIAHGFPIRDRNNEIGIDIPVEMMAALGGAKHAVDFEGGLILKGLSTAFVPIKVSDDFISWHCIHNGNGQRLSYLDVVAQCPNRAMLQDVNFGNFKEKRAILGWWSNVEPRLGTKDIFYENISWSTSPEVKRSLNISEASFGIQNIGTGELKFSMPAKDNRLRIRREGPRRFQRVVEWSNQLSVLLYDCDDRRGWLVTASDTMLHIAITKLSRKPSALGACSNILTFLKFADPENHGFDSGRQALLKNEFLKLDENNDTSDEGYLFKDLVFELWSSIECLLDRNIEQAAVPGRSISLRAREKLRGWEFMDIVGDVSTLRQREITISKTSGGWVDLIKDIDAVVLFASGFGDLITPILPHHGLCHKWRAVPKDKDYMAAGIPVLNMLYARAGCSLSRKHITQTGISWHQSTSVFEPCKRWKGFRCNCRRLQQLVKDSRVFTRKVQPSQLGERGAVIFGRDRFMNDIPTAGPPPMQSFYSQPNVRIDFSTDEIET